METTYINPSGKTGSIVNTVRLLLFLTRLVSDEAQGDKTQIGEASGGLKNTSWKRKQSNALFVGLLFGIWCRLTVGNSLSSVTM